MKKIIRILLIGFFCALPTLVQAQAARKITCAIEAPEVIGVVYNEEKFTCHVYSILPAFAEEYLKDLKEHKIGADGIPASVCKDHLTVKVAVAHQATFNIEAVNGCRIVVLVDWEGYEVAPMYSVVTRNMQPPVFKIIKEKAEVLPEDMRSDTIPNVDVEGRGKGAGPRAKSVVEEVDGELILRIDDLPHVFRGRANSRVIIQPYWLDGYDIGDTIKVFAWADPVVYDYNEYYRTQVRRMDFNIKANDKSSHFMVNDFMVNDPTNRYYDGNDSTRTRVVINGDTLRLQHYVDTLSGHNPDEAYPYPTRAVIAVEDYNQRYVLDTIPINEGERTNFIKFLDFSFEKNLDVNLADFEERMEVRPMDSNGEIKLNFEVGKATLNPKDTTNTHILAEARRELQEAFRESSSKLRFMQVYGYSSPEGSPQFNEDLARRRADFVMRELKSVIPHDMHRFIQPSESEILGWDVVADSLAKDSLITIAQQVREIVAKYPNNLVSQGQAVARLSSYATLIKPIYLPKLRSVRYTYIKVEDRTFRDDELVQMFNEGKDSDPDAGFARAHYYSLIKYYWDKREEPETRARLEEIAKRALVNTRLTKEDLAEKSDSLYNGGYWALAANVLAISYIKRDTFDLDLLRPFINRTVLIDPVSGEKYYEEGLKQMRQKFDVSGRSIGVINYTNFPEIIAEQMIMLLMQPDRKNMEELGQLADMIASDPTCKETYSKLLALVNCKRGYFRERSGWTQEEASELRALISDISPINSVIMNIFEASVLNDEVARKELLDKQFDQLPETSVAWYLKAIIELLRTEKTPNYDAAAKYLAESFKLDLRKMPIANNDQQLIHNRIKIVVPAFTKWEEMMKSEAYSNLDSQRLESDGVDSLQLATWQKEGEYDKIEPYVITDHPYYWYEKAVAARTSENGNDVIRNLEKCVACDPDYLSVINVARFADVEVKASKKTQKLFDMFFNEMRKRK